MRDRLLLLTGMEIGIGWRLCLSSGTAQTEGLLHIRVQVARQVAEIRHRMPDIPVAFYPKEKQVDDCTTSGFSLAALAFDEQHNRCRRVHHTEADKKGQQLR
jgi:hypothetical protein